MARRFGQVWAVALGRARGPVDLASKNRSNVRPGEVVPLEQQWGCERCGERVSVAVAEIEPGGLRWSPFGGQIGGFAKLGSGLRHAASSMPAAVVWTSAGVRPPKAV